MKPALVTCYVDPDLDGVSGSFAYAEFLQKTGKSAVAGIFGKPHEEAKYILNRFDIPYPQEFPDAHEFDEVILVDSSDLKGLGNKVSPPKVIEIIDHRKINDTNAFPNARIQIELVGAAATLVAEKFIESNVAISKESAILLCGGIVSNTLNFKAGVTTDRDREAFEWLNNEAQLPESFWKELVTERELEILQILNTIKEERDLDSIFQSTFELEDEKNFFVTDDDEMKKLLEKALGIEFAYNIAIREGLIMRKQIVPLLKAELEV